MWKWAILGSPDPPKPLQGPPDPTGGPGRPKMAKINIIQSTGDNLGQQIIFGGCQFFSSVFSLGMTQKVKFWEENNLKFRGDATELGAKFG